MTLALLSTAQHVSDVNTSIFWSLRLLVVLCRLTWGVLMLCSGIVCWWCGIRVYAEPLLLTARKVTTLYATRMLLTKLKVRHVSLSWTRLTKSAPAIPAISVCFNIIPAPTPRFFQVTYSETNYVMGFMVNASTSCIIPWLLDDEVCGDNYCDHHFVPVRDIPWQSSHSQANGPYGSEGPWIQ